MSPTLPQKGSIPLLGSSRILYLFFRVLCLFLVIGLWPRLTRCCPIIPLGPPLDVASKAYLAPLVFQGKLLKIETEWPVVKATFRIQKLFKTMPSTMTFFQEKTDAIVEFSSSSSGLSPFRKGRSPCRGYPLDGTELKIQQRYLVFAGIKRTRTLLGVNRPEPHTKRKALARILCDQCAKPPTVRGLGGDIRAELRSKLRLKCKFSGNPPPRIAWFKNGVKVKSNDRIRIRTKKRYSRLVIRRISRTDTGRYECKVTNILGNASASARIYVAGTTDRRPQVPPTNESTLWPLQGLPCKMTTYCLNGGTCSLYETLGEYVCECAEGYRGRRCESKGSTLSNVPQSPHDLDETTKMLQLFWGK